MSRRRLTSPEVIDGPGSHQISDPGVSDLEAQVWKRPSALEAPPPRPGMHQRWIRTSLGGDHDGRHLSKKMREGWRPRPKETVSADFQPPTIQHGTLGEVIGVDGLVLCELPKKMVSQRNAYFAQRTKAQMDGVQQDLAAAEHPAMPMVQKVFKSESARVGKRGAIADD